MIMARSFGLCVFALLLVASNANVYLTFPAGSQAVFDSDEASFGPAIPDSGVTGVVQVASNITACTPIDPPHTNGSTIVVVSRGPENDACSFLEKVLNAQAAGFQAVIIFNYDDSDLISPGADNDTSSVLIPSVLVTNTAGNTLRIAPSGTIARITTTSTTSWSSFLVTFVAIVAAGIVVFTIFMFYRHRRLQLREQSFASMTRAELTKLPSRSYKPGDEPESCCICLSDYESGDVLISLACEHEFHKSCIEPWLTSHRTCPLCKRDPAPTERTPLVCTSAP
jgi:E3 ubiquitin-protein ligase RNF13